MKKLPFIVQLLIAFGSIALSVVGIAFYLDSYTNHGKTAKVPKVYAKSLKDAIKIIKDAGFDYSVDSTYRDSLPPLQVIKQYPLEGDLVKAGRTIQLIVNKSKPPQVAMPALLGVRLSSALQYLDRSSLKLADTIFKPDFAAGRVLRQLVDGKDIAAGTVINFGTKVTLVVSSGLGATIYNYPDLYGKTLQEAYAILDTLGLSRGAISMDAGTKDSLSALVYKQYPEPWDPYENRPTLVRQGNTVDLFIASKLKPREIDTTKILVDDKEFDQMQKAEDELLQYDTKDDLKDPNKRRRRPNKPKQPAAATPTAPAPKPENDYEK